MPTSDVATMLDKNMGFEDFVLYCGRCSKSESNFSKDLRKRNTESVHTYLVEAEDKLQAFTSLSSGEKLEWAIKDLKTTLSYLEEHRQAAIIEEMKIKRMMDKVQVWTPPTPEHDWLKKSMIEQLELSGGASSYYVIRIAELKARAPKVHVEEHLTTLQNNVAFYRENYQKYLNYEHDQDLWVKQLKESLKKPQPPREQ